MPRNTCMCRMNVRVLGSSPEANACLLVRTMMPGLCKLNSLQHLEDKSSQHLVLVATSIYLCITMYKPVIVNTFKLHTVMLPSLFKLHACLLVAAV